MSHHSTAPSPNLQTQTGNSAGSPHGNLQEARTQSAPETRTVSLDADRESVRTSASDEDARSAPVPSPTPTFANPAPLSTPPRPRALGFSARQAAELLGKDEKTVRTWLRTGRLRARKEHGAWSIPQAELNAILLAEVRSADRESGRAFPNARPGARSSKPQQNQGEPAVAGPGSDRESVRASAPPPHAPSADSALLNQLHAQIADRDRRLEDKDLRIAELKGGFERQLAEKDQRLNEKDQRIADIKEEREKDRRFFDEMFASANRLVQSLEHQVARLEAPRPHSRVSVLEVKPEITPEQGEEEPAAPGQAPVATADDADSDEPTRPWWRRW